MLCKLSNQGMALRTLLHGVRVCVHIALGKWSETVYPVRLHRKSLGHVKPSRVFASHSSLWLYLRTPKLFSLKLFVDKRLNLCQPNAIGFVVHRIWPMHL